MTTLLLRIGAPLQSWGSANSYNIKRTDFVPTKSGVIGMIASALGRDRNDDISDLTSLEFGVRIDYQGNILTDYHITQMSDKISTNISKRQYLCDALFLVAIRGEDQMIEGIKEALNHPTHQLYLGRRACPITLPIDLGTSDLNLYDALYTHDWLLPQWRQDALLKNRKQIELRIITDENAEDVNPYIYCAVSRDVPVRFKGSVYKYRYIKEQPPRIMRSDPKQETMAFMEHDAFAELERNNIA